MGAHDDDFGTNAAITYSLSLEQPEYLQVNPITGWVFVNQPISQVSQSAVINSLSLSHSHSLHHMAACGSVLTKSMNKPPESASVCRSRSGLGVIPEVPHVERPQRNKMESD